MPVGGDKWLSLKWVIEAFTAFRWFFQKQDKWVTDSEIAYFLTSMKNSKE